MDRQTNLSNNIADAHKHRVERHNQKNDSKTRNKKINMDFGFSYAKGVDGKDESKDITGDLDLENDNKRPHEKNIWRHRNTSNPDFYHSNYRNSGKNISISVKTNTSGGTYEDIDVFVEAKSRQVKKENKSFHGRCRIIKVIAVISVMLVLGIIAFFIVYNIVKKDSCDKLSTINNGNVSMSDSSKNVVHCNEGSRPENSLTLICKNGKWSTLQPCPLVDCGQYPVIANGIVDGTDTTFGFTAKLQCRPGFILNLMTTFTCLANGNWSSDNEPLCIPHPCGHYTLTDYVLVKEDFSHINMTIDTECDNGFDFATGSDTYILCNNGSWKNNPSCEVQGNLSLETQNNTLLVSGKPFSIRCRLTASPDWRTVILARTDSNASDEKPLITVTNTRSNVIIETSDDAIHFDNSVERLTNGVMVAATFHQIHCRDTGLYTCVVEVGNSEGIKVNKTVRRHFTVIDISSTVESITAETMLTQGDEMVVRCTAKLGIDQNRTKLADIAMKIKHKHKSTAEIIASSIESSRPQGCQIDQTINSTILVTNDMNGAELQCVLESNNGEKQKKSVLLNVKTTIVHVSLSPSSVYIGNSFNISTELNNIHGWESLEFRKNCTDGQIVVAEIKNDENISSWVVDEHIVLSDIKVTDSKAKITLYVNGTKCSDACGKGGEIEYISAVKLVDSWVEKSVKVIFQVNPTTPVLTTTNGKFYFGQEAVITCIGNVGIPGRDIVMKENSEILLSRQLDSKSKIHKETCENVTTVWYSFTVTEEDDGTTFKCETSNDTGTMTSNILTVNVTEAIFYFTEESKTGQIGSSKKIQCVLTTIAHLATVVVSRFSSESKLCEVNISDHNISSDCSAPGFSVVGSYSLNDSVFTTTVTIEEVNCSSKGVYVCRTNTAQTKMDFKVTRDVRRPYLSLPTTLVEDQKTEWEDILTCTADVGYPRDDKALQIQIKYRDSPSYQDYSSIEKAKECRENTSITLKQHTFLENQNGSTLRCVILDKDAKIIASSLEKSIRLIKNVCIDGSAGEYYLHPYNCRRYIRCVGTRLYDSECAAGSCALSDTDNICNEKCLKCDQNLFL